MAFSVRGVTAPVRPRSASCHAVGETSAGVAPFTRGLAQVCCNGRHFTFRRAQGRDILDNIVKFPVEGR